MEALLWLSNLVSSFSHQLCREVTMPSRFLLTLATSNKVYERGIGCVSSLYSSLMSGTAKWSLQGLSLPREIWSCTTQIGMWGSIGKGLFLSCPVLWATMKSFGSHLTRASECVLHKVKEIQSCAEIICNGFEDQFIALFSLVETG